MVAILTRVCRLACFLSAAAACCGWIADRVAACETPVYRYAMYRWAPTPYEVYLFHDQPTGEQADRVAKLIAEASEKTENRANVVHLAVDLASDTALNSVPPDVKKAWQERADKSLPAYVVSTPYGVEMFSGELDAKAVQSLLESPARLKLAKQLEAGKIGVFVLLEGKQADENDRVEKVLRGLAQEVADGQVNLYVSPNQDAGEGEQSESTEQHELGLIRVKRDAAEEQWFVRTLLAMEPDLKEEKRTMVYLVYGRARALLPYIGDGITRENLLREVEFISGACSCTVKEQNPGVDLLVRYDWEAASAAIADKFGTEEGNESQFGVDMFFPDLVIPSSEAETTEVAAASENADAEGVTAAVDEAGSPAENSTDATDGGQTANEEAVEEDPSLAASGDSEALAATGDERLVANSNTTVGESPSSPSPSVGSQSSGYSSIMIVGAGLALAMVVLFGLTFVVMRPQ